MWYIRIHIHMEMILWIRNGRTCSSAFSWIWHVTRHYTTAELHWLDVPQRVTTSSARMSTVVCSARLRHTWWISAHQSPTSPVGSIYVRLAATSSSFHVTVARSYAVGPSLLRVRWPGTHCQTASEIRLCQPALSDVIWRLFFSPLTSVPAH